MSFSKIAWRSSLVRNVCAEPGPGVELDLAVARVVLVQVEQDDQAVVDALAADAPLVHERDRVGLGLRGRDAVRHELGVDDHLGSGPVLDAVDRGLDLTPDAVGEHPRRVVDGLVVHGGRERGSGGDRDRDERQGDERHDGRCTARARRARRMIGGAGACGIRARIRDRAPRQEGADEGATGCPADVRPARPAEPRGGGRGSSGPARPPARTGRSSASGRCRPPRPRPRPGARPPSRSRPRSRRRPRSASARAPRPGS